MKTYDETVQSVMDKMAVRRAFVKKRNRIICAAAAPVCCVCLLAGIGIATKPDSTAVTPNPPTLQSPAIQGPVIPTTIPDEPEVALPQNTAHNIIRIHPIDPITPEYAYIALMRDDFIPMTHKELEDYYGISIAPKIPADMEAKAGSTGIYRKDKGKGDVYHDQNRIEYSSDNDDRRIVIDLRKGALPFYDEIPYAPETECSVINGQEMDIGMTPEGYYQVTFLYNNIGFFLFASDITEEELITFLSSLIV